jgi:sensor histidine kinase YesM
MKSAATINVFASGGEKVFRNDVLIKSFCIPLIAIGIVNFTGLIHNKNYSTFNLLISYTYFIALAWVIWQGNVQVMILLKKNFKVSYNVYYKSILALYVTIIAYTIIATTGGVALWLYFSLEDKTAFDHLPAAVAITVVAAIFITNLYEIFYLKSEQADTIKRAEQLNLAKTHAELVALKNQIDPHFIFNSLNTLSYLISIDPANARLYNDTLAKVYHYILFNKEKNFVLVREEIEFLSNFFYLLKIRFGNAIDMIVKIDSLQAEELYIPPISLQILLENAIKHNELNETAPLIIDVDVSANFILVKNRMHKKQYAASGTGSGLNNLDNRYKLLTTKNIIVYKNADYFIVKLPVLNTRK